MWPLAGLALIAVVVGLCLLNNLRHSSAPSVVQNSVTNEPAPVSLADFADVQTQVWRSVPRGTQVCDGVTFICNGAIRPAGLRAARDGHRYPGAVLGLPVNQRGGRIHLLQASENSLGMTPGAPYGRMVLHYANNESRRFDLLFGVHGNDWFGSQRHPDEPVADPNSKVAWSQLRQRDGVTVRFYHTELENPLPKVAITTVDFISPLYGANLMLFGLTIDDGSHPLAPPYVPDDSIFESPASDRVTFTLQDSSGRPATTATLTLTVQVPGVPIDFPPFPADVHGQIVIDMPRKSIRTIQYMASAPDGSSVSGELEPGATGSFPSGPVLKLASARPPGEAVPRKQ